MIIGEFCLYKKAPPSFRSGVVMFDNYSLSGQFA
nr:MAG TPA: hypothetical protein [Caudoviricetes sp.]